MTRTNGVPTSTNQSQPLALHIRSLRQWSGDKEIAQKELAELAGISYRTLKEYESCRDLPRSLACLLSVAIALQVPAERLVDPRQLFRLTKEIEARRSEREKQCR